MKIYAKAVFVFVAAFLSAPLFVLADYSVHPDAHIFTDRMVSEHKLDRSYVKSLLQNASKQQSIIDAMTRPAEKVKTWGNIEKFLFKKDELIKGLSFGLKTLIL